MRSTSGKDGRKWTSVLTESRSTHARPVVGSVDSTAPRALAHVPPLNVRQNLSRNARKLIVVYPFWTSSGFRYHDAPMSSSSAMAGFRTTWVPAFPSTMTSPDADVMRPSYCRGSAGMCRSAATGWGFTANWRARNPTVHTRTRPAVVRRPGARATTPSPAVPRPPAPRQRPPLQQPRVTNHDDGMRPHTQASDRTRRERGDPRREAPRGHHGQQHDEGHHQGRQRAHGPPQRPDGARTETHRVKTTVATHAPARSRDERRSRPRSSHRTTGRSQRR